MIGHLFLINDVLSICHVSYSFFISIGHIMLSYLFLDFCVESFVLKYIYLAMNDS